MRGETVKAMSSRFDVLDYMRGLFITVIIIDHIWRWPNIFQYMTGRGELWVSAAEGFVMISGLLVGLVHGYKKRHTPMRDITFKLFRRGIMLYLWSFITTFVIVAVGWLIVSNGPVGHIDIPTNDWWSLIINSLRMDYTHSLNHFLHLYAVYLLLAPVVIALLRKGLWWVVALLSVGTYLIGFDADVEWMQWQILFFGASIVGYYFTHIQRWFTSTPQVLQHTIRVMSILIFAGCFAFSMSTTLPHEYVGTYINPLFTRWPMTMGTLIMSALWFIGLMSLFHYALPLIKRTVGWMLIEFGQRSLTAYILQILPVLFVQVVIPETTGFLVNSLISLWAVLCTWLLLRIPRVNAIIPR